MLFVACHLMLYSVAHNPFPFCKILHVLQFTRVSINLHCHRTVPSAMLKFQQLCNHLRTRVFLVAHVIFPAQHFRRTRVNIYVTWDAIIIQTTAYVALFLVHLRVRLCLAWVFFAPISTVYLVAQCVSDVTWKLSRIAGTSVFSIFSYYTKLYNKVAQQK